MAVKEIKKETYVWSHIGVITFHSLLAIILIMTRYYKNLFNVNSADLVMGIGILLLVVSLLGLWPILKNHEKIEIK